MSDTTLPPAINGTFGDNSTALPPPPPPLTEIPILERAAYLSRIYISATSVLLLLCTLTFLTRMYQRVRPVWKVGWDDYFICMGYVSLHLRCAGSRDSG